MDSCRGVMKPDVGAFLAFLTLMADGAVDGTNHHFAVHHIPEEWDLEQVEHQPSMRLVELLLRERDQHTPTVNPLAYLPIVPTGFAQGN
jgi:hypothetical protein